MASAQQKAEMKLRKKLREIEEIESRIHAGESLDRLQLQKVEGKATILLDLADATAGLTVSCQPETATPPHTEHRPQQDARAGAPPRSAASSSAAGRDGTMENFRRLHAKPSCSIDPAAVGMDEDWSCSMEIEDGTAAVSMEQNRSTSHAAHKVVACTATQQCPRMERAEITGFVAKPHFGPRLCGRNCGKHNLFNRVAQLAIPNSHLKVTALESKLWKLCWQSDEWLRLPINLWRCRDREAFQCTPDVYNYTGVPAGTLVVDFANKHIGGGCFGGGFVQEEQMVMQSTDFAARLHAHRQKLSWHQGISYEGVYMDAWWPRVAAAKKGALAVADIQSHTSNPLTILAVDAPKMGKGLTYCPDTLQMLTAKVLLIFTVAEHLHCPQIFSGLLGGGAFRNNRPLVLLLHLLLQPASDTRPVLFHHPVFWSYAGLDTQTLEQNIVDQADSMIGALRAQGVTTLGDALTTILSWRLPLSECDADLA